MEVAVERSLREVVVGVRWNEEIVIGFRGEVGLREERVRIMKLGFDEMGMELVGLLEIQMGMAGAAREGRGAQN